MSRRHVAVWIVAVALLGGCGQGANGLGGVGDDGRDRLRQQAHDALARYDAAVLEAGGTQVFVPVGELIGQIGDWEAAIGENNKVALNAGLVVTMATLPAAPQPTGTVTWDSGTTHRVPLLPADETLGQLRQTGIGDCPECVPLEVIGARLTTVRVQTTRGPATAPAWEYTVKGTAVRVTRVAVASSAMIRVTPPSWDPYNAPGGISIESATTTTCSTQLTVAFTGSPHPASQPCGVDYTGEAVESANAVVVIVNQRPHSANETCDSAGARRTATVELAQPLGERAVLEVQQGLPVALTITA